MKNRARILAILGGVVLVVALSFGGGVLGSRLAHGSSLSSSVQFGVSPTAATGSSTSAYSVTNVVGTPAALNTSSQSQIAQSFQQQFRTVAAQTLPEVVEVNVTETVTQQVPESPFDFFFGQQGQSQQRQYEQQGLGSGVIVARDGKKVYVLTNYHVAGKADKIQIVLSDQRTFDGKLVGSDELMDLALVSFETNEQVPIAALGDSSTLQAGDWVFAVGNPLGFQSTITAGIISATARHAQAGSGMSGITDYIQTDAAINQGNSGGPLVNLNGEVIGINTWIASQSGGSIGLGFAIPINNAKRAINDFLTNGEVTYSWLGVQVSSIGDSLAKELNLSDTNGAFVSGVYENSPAQQSGLQAGDVITRIGDTAIDTSNTLVTTVANLAPGARVPFTIIRNGQTETLAVQTGKRTADSGTQDAVWPGLSVAPLTSDVRTQLSLASSVNGVVIAGVADNSPASDSGMRAGDTITAVNGNRINSISDFYKQINASGNSDVQFRVIRDGHQLILGFVKPNA